MCNEAARRIALDQLRNDWSELKIPLRFPEGLPNFQPTDSIRITDPLAIIRAAADAPNEAELVTRRWSWPAPTGKPVYNYRSDGREFRNSASQGRCLIPIDGFYEFTDASPLPLPEGVGGGDDGLNLTPDLPSPNPSRKREGKPRKAKWKFRVNGLDWFCVAGLWRTYAGEDDTPAEAWTMLTTEPGPDIAPYHSRQIVILTPPDYARWLDGSAPAADLCRPLPAGTLSATRIR
jgi:putative SOS response-associated peptidase YedK